MKKFHLERYPSEEEPKPILIPRPDVGWEGKAVFNPSVVQDKDLVRMLFRTDKGWLLIYSGESMSDSWTIGAASSTSMNRTN
ncbi:MAG: hypothetical protein KGI45_00230 [Patescibacteria group bacterium]|nr:hypothetical protein [Patescibacteria group bacterium]MDE1966490.1 hypothetical protein [Patescibacteria group bacterium]